MTPLIHVPLESLLIDKSYLHYSGNPYLPGPNLVTVRRIWHYTNDRAMVYTDDPIKTFVVFNYNEPLDPKNRFYIVPDGPYPSAPPEDLGDGGMGILRQILLTYESKEGDNPSQAVEPLLQDEENPE